MSYSLHNILKKSQLKTPPKINFQLRPFHLPATISSVWELTKPHRNSNRRCGIRYSPRVRAQSPLVRQSAGRETRSAEQAVNVDTRKLRKRCTACSKPSADVAADTATGVCSASLPIS